MEIKASRAAREAAKEAYRSPAVKMVILESGSMLCTSKLTVNNPWKDNDEEEEW